MWKNLCESISSCPFLTGFVLGVVACVVISLAFLLLFRYCCAIRVPSFTYSSAGGKITIRSSAIISLIFVLEKDFPEFDMVRAGLFRKGKTVFLKVVVDYRPGSRTFSDVVSLFQQSALDKLKESFGIETVTEVEVCMRDALPVSGQSEE